MIVRSPMTWFTTIHCHITRFTTWQYYKSNIFWRRLSIQLKMQSFFRGLCNTKILSRVLKKLTLHSLLPLKCIASRGGCCHHITPRSFQQPAAHRYTLSIRTQRYLHHLMQYLCAREWEGSWAAVIISTIDVNLEAHRPK